MNNLVVLYIEAFQYSVHRGISAIGTSRHFSTRYIEAFQQSAYRGISVLGKSRHFSTRYIEAFQQSAYRGIPVLGKSRHFSTRYITYHAERYANNEQLWCEPCSWFQVPHLEDWW